VVPEHKLRQQLYHHLNPNPSDLNIDIALLAVEGAELASGIIDYFVNANHKIVYPAKSYAVALIYAHKLESIFNIPVKVSLNDPELLFNNDPYFIPYSNASNVYNIVLNHFKAHGNGLQ